MSSVNRVLEKRRKQQHNNQPQTSGEGENAPFGAPAAHQAQEKPAHDNEREKLFQNYVEHSQYNPANMEFSNSYIPCSLSLYNRYRAPMSCFISPVNDSLEYVERSAAEIPRCSSCRAYMNYYNEATHKGFKCFLCGRENTYDIDYSPDSNWIERTSPSYLIDGATGVYSNVPPEKVFIFLVDISKEAWQCKMISYMVAALKEVLSNEEMNETQIYFYTFDETIHQYDFSGAEVERTILDPTLKENPVRTGDCFIGEIRDKLIPFLDSLEEVSEKNPRQGSNFMAIFEYVYENIKHTGGKMFVFQANEAIIGQSFANENFKPLNPPAQEVKPKSLLETKNKQFFNRFVQSMLGDNISMSLFVFGRAFKNIRVYSDTCKLTNSELLFYSKDSSEDLNKFYYQLFQLTSATYYIDTRIEFMISSGWYYTAVYGNLYRLKEFISFKFCHLERSKRICAVFLPQEGFNPMPYFSLQVVTNYIYNRKHYMSVNTAVMPFTSNIDYLFENINHQISSATIFRTYLSTLRLEEITSCRSKYVKHVASIWKAANDYYKGNITPEYRNVLLSFLAFLKNYHSQIEAINDTPLLDRVISQRNILQACGYLECCALFTPYLFDLATIGDDRCLEDNFLYPDVCELRFESVKEGLFLLDGGVALYLFIARKAHPGYLSALFGKQKLGKGELLSEQVISQQQNKYSEQVTTLIRVLRESKSFGWVPLYVVRCGESTLHEKNFYLHFYEQKYAEYKSSNLSYDEFINMLSKQY